jgi:hypothetical protein
MGLLHQSRHLVYLLLLESLDAGIDALLVGLVEKVELFLFHHASQFL